AVAVQGSGRRMVMWISLATGALVAVLVAVLASAGPAGQQTGSPLVGKPAPPINGPPITPGAAGTVRLGAFEGKWVLVNFAASWCVPCQQEMPQLLAFVQRHAAGDAVVLTVGYDENDIGGLRSLLQARHATWPAVDDPQAKVRYGLRGVPESYLIDPAGTVVAKYSGGVNADRLDSFIGQFTSTSPPA
ncbi:MAG: TlpA family protein disulfide reductase, partial [Acidimicrobiales bacterium]